MEATIAEERRIASETSSMGFLALFKGTNGWRLLIACWPKVTQQFVGLTIFNSYSTYFCELPGTVRNLSDP
jgi:SP family general alpha glucoside:H+ symporter-like MFS transporter